MNFYSKEELTAETGSAFLCAIAEVATEHTEMNATEYVKKWICALRSDNRLVAHAAAAAQKGG
jgi:antirestriction protein ArdC